MRSMLPRIKASLILTPAVMLLLVFIVCFTGVGGPLHVNVWALLGWSVACSLAISYLFTLYVALVAESLRK